MHSHTFFMDIGAIALCSVPFVLLWLIKRRAKLPLPPGPEGLPIVGNLLQLPQENPWETYHEWCEHHGTDILHVNAAGRPMVILDTTEVATDLLEKRSSIYSNRMRLPMVGDLMGWNVLLAFTPYGPRWRQRRRLMHHSFHPEAALKFQAYEVKATHKFLLRLLEGPQVVDVLREIRQMSGETIMKVAYGLDVLKDNDPYIEAVERGMETLSPAGVPGAFLVDAIPAMKYIPDWFPGASFKRKAKEWRKTVEYMFDLPFHDGIAKLQAGDDAYSFLSNAIKQRDDRDDIRDHMNDVQTATGTVYTAGSDTTVSVIASAILGLLDHPEFLKKAQEEHDEAVGYDRLPSFEDYERLPYITAIVKEALRWKTVGPIAIPHMLDAEDEYRGYRIPKGSIIIPNAWAMLHNPKVYPDPFTFNPDRFMKTDGSGELDPSVKDPAHAAFGFGRRICPGRYMAFHSVWIAIASLISVFDIQKAVDEDGNEIPLTHAYRSGLVNSPEPYVCTFKIRSREAEDLVRATIHDEHARS